jgi:hypothetical protein
MQHKTAWNFGPRGSNRLRELLKPGGTNRLRELLKLYGCEDVVTAVDEDAFGRRSSELIQASFRKIASASNAEMKTKRKRKASSESSFVRLPKPSAEQRARDAAAATAEYKAEELATREKTASFEERSGAQTPKQLRAEVKREAEEDWADSCIKPEIRMGPREEL